MSWLAVPCVCTSQGRTHSEELLRAMHQKRHPSMVSAPLHVTDKDRPSFLGSPVTLLSQGYPVLGGAG